MIGKEELAELLDVMNSGYLFRYGSLHDQAFKRKVYSLEREFEAYSGANHALALTSGSAALIVALKALDIQPGDEIIVPAYTFIASYSAIIFCGGTPVLAEIDDSLTIDPEDIEKRITAKTRAIMPVHMLGNACDMDAIMEIAKRHGLIVIEDACQANGGSYKGQKLGAIGDIGTFSLNIFKTITSGDGGILITDEEDIYTRAFAVHDQGHLPNRTGVEVGSRSILGMNFRMNELTGAVALAQLRRLDGIIQILRQKKAQLKSLLQGIPAIGFRRLNDPAGDCATLCTLLLSSAAQAAGVAQQLATTTVDNSGWHVYANMEHFNRWLKEQGMPHGKGAFPRTDDTLSRAINLSVGVVDAGLGAGFGINIHSDEAEIEQIAAKIAKAFTE
ncbi:MAG: DegT/DnrJ/EryC1/StrS family aminotransferase [Calditrichaeota bacterium]|nr:MAG: DegT/DnrJ/EryC1/StrS family aminotransferase [Calditrichota bacterium]